MAKLQDIPDLDKVDRDAPLRLTVAASLAFPDGSMSASGLRKEAAKGRLVIERIAGKDYTTLANIEHMRGLCRLEQKGLDCGCEKQGETSAGPSHIQPSGSSSTDAAKRAQSAARMIVSELSERLSNTSIESTLPRRRKASVIPLKST
jgi:hypothetical protein